MTSNDNTGRGDFLAELKAKRAALLKDMQIIDEAIASIEKLSHLGFMIPNQDSLFPEFVHTKVNWKTDKPDISNLSVAQAAVQILWETGRPMKTREILDILRERGKETNAGNPFTSTYSSLSKHASKSYSELKNMGDGMWGLKKRD